MYFIQKMEILGLIDLPGWLVGIFVFINAVCIYSKYKQTYFQRRGIAVFPPTLLIGDMRTVAKKGFASYLDADVVQKYGKVFGTYSFSVPSLVISDTEMIKEILVKQFSNFTDRMSLNFTMAPKWNASLSIASGVHWRFLRSTLSPTFTTGKMRLMDTYIQRCLDTLHGVIQQKMQDSPEGFDVSPVMECYTLDVICSTGFGMDIDSQRNKDDPFVKHCRKILDTSALKSPLVIINLLFPDLMFVWKHKPLEFIAKDTWEFLESATQSAFTERKKSNTGHKDLLQLMINAQREDHDTILGDDVSIEDFKKRGLTDEEILINSVVFLSAAFSTTSITFSWFLYELAAHPELQEKMFQEIQSDIGEALPTYDEVFKLRYLDMFMNEVMRVHPLASRYPYSLYRRRVRSFGTDTHKMASMSKSGRIVRCTKNDTEVCGVKIEKGMTIWICPAALHFMPEYWDHPKQFDPERFAPENKDKLNEYAFIPFGLGPRRCIGMRLAELEIKMTITSLIQKYRIVGSTELQVPMPSSKGRIMKPDSPVIVKFVPRNGTK